MCTHRLQHFKQKQKTIESFDIQFVPWSRDFEIWLLYGTKIQCIRADSIEMNTLITPKAKFF